MQNPRRAWLHPVVGFALVIIAAMTLLVACSSNGEPVATNATPSATEPADPSAPDAAADTRSSQSAAARADGGAGDDGAAEPAEPVGDPTEVTLTSIGDFDRPVDVIVRPGDDRVFVVQASGTLTAIESATTSGATILDISDQTFVQGERGFLGAAFHPSDDLLYVHYTDRDSNSVIAEFEVDAESGAADAGSERTLMIVEQPFNNHNGGEVDFGPDGHLYLGFGDGGSRNDPNRAALDLSTPLGKILRVDPRANDSAPFTIPSDNPFVDDDDADPAIWSYGLRNPWKFSFDSVTGDLWIADVGQNEWEEIDAARAADGMNAGRGLSFGWSAFEGFEAFNRDQPSNGHTEPFFTYDRSNGRCSISGGAVSRDPSIPELDGWYVYGDFCSGQIFAIDGRGDSEQRAIELGRVSELVSIATGADGALYASSFGGSVFRLG